MGCGRERDDNWLVCSVLGRNWQLKGKNSIKATLQQEGDRSAEKAESRKGQIDRKCRRPRHNVPGLWLPCRCLGVCDLPIEASWNNL